MKNIIELLSGWFLSPKSDNEEKVISFHEASIRMLKKRQKEIEFNYDRVNKEIEECKDRLDDLREARNEYIRVLNEGFDHLDDFENESNISSIH